MSQTTLCIIDMQDYFIETAHHCVGGVLNEIKYAKKHRHDIVLVEYGDRYHQSDPHPLSKTITPIVNALKRYSKVFNVLKFRDGGGELILEELKTQSRPMDKFRLVGVNRGYCIMETAQELKASTSKYNGGKAGIVEVVRGATWCSYPRDSIAQLQQQHISLVNQHRRVAVVNNKLS